MAHPRLSQTFSSGLNPPKLFRGFITRRERLGLSLKGWAAMLMLFAATFLLWLFHIQPFLAETHRVNTPVLVMEGWIQEYASRVAADEFRAGGYQIAYTTGGPIAGTDDDTNDETTTAGVGASFLIKAGLPAQLVQKVPCHQVGRDRTYSSAVALREWSRAHGRNITSFNVITEDAHARRTQLLFQEAFGPDVAVGIIAIRDPEYDPKHWWRYSEGVREVLGESIAYIYAKFVFHPPAIPSPR